MKTRNELLAHCKKALAQGWKYVYGAKCQVLTRQQIKNLQNRYGKNMVWNSDLNKAGHICCDCSGLISSCTGVTRGSSQYKSTATATATISQLKANWSAYVGWGIWMNGHIGVVSDTPGYYYAMDGSGRNMVHNPLNKNNWVCVIKLCDINYGATVTPTPTQKTTASNNSDIDVYYRAYAGKWYSEVKNTNDYAGVENKGISGVAARASRGVVKYRVHVKSQNKWLPFVTTSNINNANGYAGVLGKDIDGIQMEINGVPGYNILYRVSVVGNSGYLPWVTNWNNTSNGYAGVFGKSIDKIQVKVVRK